MTKVKLTKPQLDVLQILCTAGRYHCVARYKPVAKLVELGFAEKKHSLFLFSRYINLVPTDAGREHLSSVLGEKK